MQASVLNGTSGEEAWMAVLAEVSAEWLGVCLWSPLIPIVALISVDWERRCAWCKAHTGMKLANANDHNSDEHLQCKFQWEADFGGSSE